MPDTPTATQRAGFDWLAAIGYQHEVAHTAVLAWLLESGDEHSLAIAGGLLGEQSVSAVANVRRQPGLGDAGTADLLFDAQLEGGESAAVAVATRVDSQATRSHLRQLCGDDARATLLALGASAFSLQEPDLVDPEDDWFARCAIIGPRRWFELLRALSQGLNVGPYIQAVEREAALHDAATKLAGSGLDREKLHSQPRMLLLAPMAWLALIRERATEFARADWTTRYSQSGGFPHMSCELVPPEEGSSANVFVQVDCEEHRQVVRLKISGSRVPQHEGLIKAARAFGLEPGKRYPKARISTLSRREVTGMTPTAVAELVTEIGTAVVKLQPPREAGKK